MLRNCYVKINIAIKKTVKTGVNSMWCDKRAYFELLYQSGLININYNIILTKYRKNNNNFVNIVFLF